MSQTLMSIHGWVRGFRMCKTSSLQLLLGQLGTPVGSHPSERRWRTFIGQEEHEISNMVPYFPDFVAYCGKRGSWLVARIGITPCSGYISFHLSKEQSCSSISNEDMLTRDFENGSSLTAWISFAGDNDSSFFFLIGLRCTLYVIRGKSIA